MSPLSRREFLAAGAGLVLAAACGGDGDDVEVENDDEPSTKRPELVVASYVHVVGVDRQRVTVSFVTAEGPFRTTGPVELAVDGAAVEAKLYEKGLELPYFAFTHRFDKAGAAKVTARADGRSFEAALLVVAAEETKVPYPGRPMIPVATPTVADHRGVEPICTRQPACPLHDVSLDAALAEKRPLALTFSTPALCQSRLCGPVLDNLLVHRDAYADRVRFVHAEIFTALDGKTTTPAVKAYGLQNEPFLFLAGADGVVRERLDNAVDQVETGEALARLVA